MVIDVKESIKSAIKNFDKQDLLHASNVLLASLGYSSDQKVKIEPNTFEGFKGSFQLTDNFNSDLAQVSNWKSVEFIFQLTGENFTKQGNVFITNKYDKKNIQSYLFFAIELEKSFYNRGVLAQITREINKLTFIPSMIIFKYGNLITLSIIDRRPNKKDVQKDVLEKKITLIKDINVTNPHRAHIEILFDLSFQQLNENYSITSFESLHDAWQKVLDTKELNKNFYTELAAWYYFAVKQIKIPIKSEYFKDDEENIKHFIVRLISRLIFSGF